MLKMPKKPKATKPPKKPKQSASAQTWINYDTRYKAWQKRELDKTNTWKRKCSDKKAKKSKKDAIIKKYSR